MTATIQSRSPSVLKLHGAGYRWPLDNEPVASGTEDQHVDS
ncbi:hypothetical protein J2X68_008036 [Streptomyces sp. 3330]|nr:hypothetical protein [Streptomyces sp. 3330]MDR6981293.1 hypothetical protein [Streptomyces sp. 3330]